MPPTKLLIFGSPKAGTPLMSAAPSIAIDLPLKILVPQGKVWISYNSSEYLKNRHSLPQDFAQNIAVVEALAAKAGRPARHLYVCHPEQSTTIRLRMDIEGSAFPTQGLRRFVFLRDLGVRFGQFFSRILGSFFASKYRVSVGPYPETSTITGSASVRAK